MNETIRMQLMSLFMQQVWNEADRICGHTQSFDQFGFLKQMGVF